MFGCLEALCVPGAPGEPNRKAFQNEGLMPKMCGNRELAVCLFLWGKEHMHVTAIKLRARGMFHWNLPRSMSLLLGIYLEK